MYYCDICSKAFKQKNDIRRHLNKLLPCGDTTHITINYVKNKYINTHVHFFFPQKQTQHSQF